MEPFRSAADLHLCQPPYNLFERGIEVDIMPCCRQNDIALMTYGARGEIIILEPMTLT
jgi:aryl-alcohol dehydrogenase-like predicted oxidoreductase